MIAAEPERQVAMKVGIGGIADRGHGREPVERAAQHDRDEAHVATARRLREARQEGPGEAAGSRRQKARRVGLGISQSDIVTSSGSRET